MSDILFRMLLGHLVGDYLLQNNYMALNKKDSNSWAGPIHCCIWTCSVLLFCPEIIHKSFSIDFWNYILLVVMVYFSHAILDYTNFVDKFLDMIGGRSYKSTEDYCERTDVTEAQKGYMRAYTALVQTVADNTMHLLMLYGIFKMYGVV